MSSYSNGIIRNQSSRMHAELSCNVYERNAEDDYWQSKPVAPIPDFSATATLSVDHLVTGSSPVRQMH